MTCYFTLSQIPELANLTRRQRKLVYQCGLEALFAEQPEAVLLGKPWLLGGLLIGVAVGMGLAAVGLDVGRHSRLLLAAASGLVGFLVGAFIAAQHFNALLRPYLRRVVEEREHEIAQIK